MKQKRRLALLAFALANKLTGGFYVQPKSSFATALHSSVETSAPKAKPQPDKLTVEAQELLDAFAAEGKEGGPKMVVAQVAPSVRVGIGEEFGLDPGVMTPGHLVAGLKELGFDAVLDTNSMADLTIMEEGTELLQRLAKKLDSNEPEVPFGEAAPGSTPMPLFTSCCPGWMNLVEKSNPELAPYVSTCKSPHMMVSFVCILSFASNHQLCDDDLPTFPFPVSTM